MWDKPKYTLLELALRTKKDRSAIRQFRLGSTPTSSYIGSSKLASHPQLGFLE